MAKVLVDERKLDRILQEVQTIRRMVISKPDNGKWVRVGTLINELKLTREQIRYARLQNPKIARKKASGHYEYDLSAYKNIAA